MRVDSGRTTAIRVHTGHCVGSASDPSIHQRLEEGTLCFVLVLLRLYLVGRRAGTERSPIVVTIWLNSLPKSRRLTR